MRVTVPLLLVASVLAGCAARRSAGLLRADVEPMLLAQAVDLALEKFEAPELAAKKVYADFANLKGPDAAYIQVATRARLAALGAVLVAKGEEADYVAEVASGTVGSESGTDRAGLPVAAASDAPMPMPRMALAKTVEPTGIVKLLIFIHAGGRFVAVNRYCAKADRDEGFVLFWRFQRAGGVREGRERADLKIDGPRDEWRDLPPPKMLTE